MAEPAQLEGDPVASSPSRDIKAEVASILEGIDFSMPEDSNMDMSQETIPSTIQNGDAEANHPQPPSQNNDLSMLNGGSEPQNGGQVRTDLSQNLPGHQEPGKRPFGELSEAAGPEAKRVKTETHIEDKTTEEPSFEDGLALLVQNALSDANNMMDHFNDGGELANTLAQTLETIEPQPAPEPIMPLRSLTPTPIRPPTPPPPSISFADEPENFVRMSGMSPLGHLVSYL